VTFGACVLLGAALVLITRHPAPPPAAVTLDTAPACTLALQSEADAAVPRAGVITLAFPPACAALGLARTQALADQIAADSVQAQAAAAALARAIPAALQEAS
jgi:hypothetical protein